MTKIKLCGLTRLCEIEAANKLKPDYIGFVFVPKRRRYVTQLQAAELKSMLCPEIQAVGVFINEDVNIVASLLNLGVIDMAQLHGNEDEDYIAQLRLLTEKPIIKAFQVKSEQEVLKAQESTADYILLDAGTGGGRKFDWKLIAGMTKPYFLAGGLDSENTGEAICALHPYALDVSSGIETDGVKDTEKMAAFVAAVRKGEET